LRAQRALASADIHPPSLPAHAILCIRQLGDPRPGRLTRDAHALRPTPEWEQAARDALVQAAATAARPARGPVPAGARAVLFADRAELLACLARDWSSDLFHACWWWRALLGSHDAAETVLRAFRDTPEAVPAAVDALAHDRWLGPFLRRLPVSSAMAIAADIARTFGLDDVDIAIAVDARSVPAPPEQKVVDRRVTQWMHRDTAERAALLAEIATIARESIDLDVDDVQRMLAVIALVLHRAPATGRRLLRRGRESVPVLVARPAREGTTSGADAGVSFRAADAEGIQPIETHKRDDGSAESSIDGRQPLPTGWPSPEALESGPDQPLREPEPGPAAPELEQPIDSPDVVATAFGGAFYLLNVAAALGLYSDFTAPRGRNLALPVWDFLSIVAARLGGPGFDGDPLSALFAQLSGRGPSEPIDRRRPVVRRVQRLVPSIRRWLARALGVHPNVAGPLVVMSRARVLIAPATIEVVFLLAEHPIEVRLSGLDRNPGFLPAAARTVVFTYA
jgi:hypothetical protein